MWRASLCGNPDHLHRSAIDHVDRVDGSAHAQRKAFPYFHPSIQPRFILHTHHARCCCTVPAPQAVQHGHWLVLENVDAAPPEAMAALGQLCDSGVLHIPQRAEAIPTAPGFQLLATLSTSPEASSSIQEALGGAWAHVAVTAPSPADVLCMMEHTFATLAPLLPTALRCCAAVQLVVGGGDTHWARCVCAVGYTTMDVV